MAPLFSRFFGRRFTGFKDNASQAADGLLNLCKETIGKSAQHFESSKIASEESEQYYLMNKHQCELLVQRLSATQSTLAYIQQLSLLDGKTISVLEELHRALLDADTVLNQSIHGINAELSLLRAALEQDDMKETFQKLLSDVQWHTDVLQSIVLDNSGQSNVTFEPALCYGQLNPTDEIALLVAMKQDEEVLTKHLSSSAKKLDDPAAQDLANQLLMRMKPMIEDQLSSVSIVTNSYHDQQLLNNREAKEQPTEVVKLDSNDRGSSSGFDLLYLDPQNLKKPHAGILLGRGSFGELRRTNLLGGKYAMKIFDQVKIDSFEQEMAALQGLGRHPHIVRLFCHSKKSAKCFLIMEEMHMDLDKFLQSRKDGRPLSIVEAVDLILQIAEGVRYVHSKRMAHRDLKPGNVLVNLADSANEDSSRVCAVKLADFGLTKTKEASRTYENQTVNTGNSKYMAPEVIATSSGKVTFNPRKADVYSFAIICFEILTGEYPYKRLFPSQFKQQVKAHTNPLRPKLPKECPPRLASLIQRCWAGVYADRPLFPEICRELRYIKGLLLRDDQKKLQIEVVFLGFESNVERAQHQGPCGDSIGDEEGTIAHVTLSMEHIKQQGPWGRNVGDKKTGLFSHVARSSIKWIKLRYNQAPATVEYLEVGYVELGGTEFVGRYCWPLRSGWTGHQDRCRKTVRLL